MYGLNKRLMMLEGRLLRTAEGCKIPREEFLKQYECQELDPNWLPKVGKLKTHKGWAKFVETAAREVIPIREQIDGIATAFGLPIDRKRVMSGKSVQVRVVHVGHRSIEKKNYTKVISIQ